MIKAVLFDMDGVLVDSFEAWLALLNATAQHYGQPPVTREGFLAVYGQSTEKDVEAFFPDQSVQEIDGYYEAHFHEHARHVVAMPDAHTVLNAVKARGLRTAVVTNTAGILARNILQGLGLVTERVIGGDEVSHAKPAPDIVLLACELLGVSPSEAIVVGDSVYDMEAAAGAGARSVGVNGITSDNTLASLAELPALLDGIKN
jgi:HAD superfamily hydrolase (TIGR01509 family)